MTNNTTALETISGEIVFTTGKKISVPEMKFNGLTIITGHNGTGKTMLLKLSWFTMFLLYNYKLYALLDPQNLQQNIERDFPLISKATFGPEDFGKLDVIISGNWNCHYTMSFLIEDNSLKQFKIQISDPEEFLGGPLSACPLFNSKECRTFESYEKYLDLLNLMNISQISTYNNALKLYTHFKLYDIIWMEHIRAKLKLLRENPEAFHNNPVIDRLLSTFLDGTSASPWSKFKRFEVKNEIPYVVFSGKEENIEDIKMKLSKLSAGEQAIIMMILFQ